MDSFKRLRNSYNVRLNLVNLAPNLVRKVSLKDDKNVGFKGLSQPDFLFKKSPSKMMGEKILYLSFILYV